MAVESGNNRLHKAITEGPKKKDQSKGQVVFQKTNTRGVTPAADAVRRRQMRRPNPR